MIWGGGVWGCLHELDASLPKLLSTPLLLLLTHNKPTVSACRAEDSAIRGSHDSKTNVHGCMDGSGRTIGLDNRMRSRAVFGVRRCVQGEQHTTFCVRVFAQLRSVSSSVDKPTHGV
ncbi:hypothetical protein D9C73_009511 [Collichthys lucidus]|uniref:Uncharacterized protein n=1 Tax=Collichthys lucidus TaxID=240159 RepID=A0A4U5UN06_COLLU|nr:hypothetical protein D9C73_009511 [Collichthys lucidus]